MLGASASQRHGASRATNAQLLGQRRAIDSLPIFAIPLSCGGMSTMNISLPQALKTYVDAQVAGRGYGTSSEYVRELIRKDQDRQQLRQLLLDGGSSPPGAAANAGYFDGLRERVPGSAGG
jgi:antitoxin ParD1/3/4